MMFNATLSNWQIILHDLILCNKKSLKILKRDMRSRKSKDWEYDRQTKTCKALHRKLKIVSHQSVVKYGAQEW
jgi:hypothetical protein